MTDREWLGHTVRAVFPDLEPDQTQAFIEQVSAEQTSEYVVKTKKERINIPKPMSVQVECHLHIHHRKIPDWSLSLTWTPAGQRDSNSGESDEKYQTIYYCKRAEPYKSRHSVGRENCDWYCPAYSSSLPSLHTGRVPSTTFSYNESHQSQKESGNWWCMEPTCESEPPQRARERDHSKDVERRVSLLFVNRRWYRLYRKTATQHIAERYWTVAKTYLSVPKPLYWTTYMTLLHRAGWRSLFHHISMKWTKKLSLHGKREQNHYRFRDSLRSLWMDQDYLRRDEWLSCLPALHGRLFRRLEGWDLHSIFRWYLGLQ